MKSVLKLGTRKSLLAWAQSGWVAREIERLNPGVRVELQGIETRGDRVLDVPLQFVDGKEFFVAEIDEALRSGAVDFTVHSMKDLSLDRPRELTLACVPKRENPRDAIVFAAGTMDRLRKGETLRIGTSSPRRLENIPPFLEKALPRVSASRGAPALEFIEIRGNVNTRLSRLSESGERRLDGVVLALAGLVRLWNDQAGRAELEKLLQGTRWMVLPLRECPTAPAQGALAVECRANDPATIEALKKLNHPETERLVAVERHLLSEWGGGCHQKFGATAVLQSEIGQILFVRGKKPDESFVDLVDAKSPQEVPPDSVVRAWDGSFWRSKCDHEQVGQAPGASNMKNKSVFLAHSRAVTPEFLGMLREARVWTSGTASWFRLAEMGIWVEGCSEGLGHEFALATLREPVLTLASEGDWIVLTHEHGKEGWGKANVLATYRVKAAYGEEARSALQSATHIFWSSGSQFEELGSLAGSTATHACGPGKTAAKILEAGIRPEIFASAKEWRRWLKI